MQRPRSSCVRGKNAALLWAVGAASIALCSAPIATEPAFVSCVTLANALGCGQPAGTTGQHSTGIDLWSLCPAECSALRTLEEVTSSPGTVPLPHHRVLRRALQTSPSQNGSNLTVMGGASVPCETANCTGQGEASPLSPSGMLLRLLPMASSVFVTYFGTKISTMVRVFSVFWASAAPSLFPVLKVIEVEGGITASTFVGIGGAFYAGALGAFAAVKKREMGIMVQGVAVGYVLSSVLQGFVIGLVLEKFPQAQEYLEWITMIFTFALGGVIGKIALKYEDLISVCATAIMGAYTQLQIFCSLGFEFSRSLSMQAAMDGTFGCTDWPCQLTLVVFILYALGGVRNQFKMNRVNTLIAENPDFEGEGKYEQTLVKINKSFAIVFALNDVVKEQGKFHTEEELEELLDKNLSIVLQLSTVGTDIGMFVLSFSMFVGVIEGFGTGAFRLTDEDGNIPYLAYFACALGAIAMMTLLLVLFAINTHKLPASQKGKRYTRMQIFLMFAAMLMPIVAGCSLIVMVMLPDTGVEVPQIKRFFDMQKLPAEQRLALEGHLPTVFATLQGTLLCLAASWVIVCKHLGGVLYLAMKFLSMITWIIFIVGVCVAGGGYWGIEHSGMTMDADITTLFLLLGIVGTFLMAVAILGIAGMKVYYKVRTLGQIILRIYSFVMLAMLVLNILLFAAVGYYATQIDVLIEEDWAKVEAIVAAKKSGVLANHTKLASVLDGTFHNETKSEFVETVKGSFSILMLTGAVITAVLLSGVLAAHFLVKTNNPIPGSKDSGDGGGDSGSNEESKQESSIAKPGKDATKEEKQAYKEAKKAEQKATREKKRANKEALQEEAKKKKMEKVKQKIKANDGVVAEKGDDASQTVENPTANDDAPDTDTGQAAAFEKEDKQPKKDKKKQKKKKEKTVSASQKDKEEAAKLQSLWTELDQDGSGFLDRTEVSAVMEFMGKPVDDAGLDAAMQEIDKDGSGEVSFEEFLAWWQKQDPEAQKQLMMLQALNFDDL